MLLTMLHLLVFVYWLGGDLGAFCASYVATDAKRAPAERALALRLVTAVDTAPVIALVLALPTGLALAISRGWVAWPMGAALAIAVVSLAWLVIALRVHGDPGPATAWLARVDYGVRIAAISIVGAFGAASLAAAAGARIPLTAVPLFIALKLCLLAACTTLGLAIRRPLRVFVAAFGTLARSGSTPDLERTLRSSMNRCRVYVVGIWMCVLAAAWLGVAKPL